MSTSKIGKLTDEELNEIFDDEWQVHVAMATDIAMSYCEDLGMSEQALIQHVIDYNMDLRFREKMSPFLVERLPKVIDWEDKSFVEIFDDFKEIIENCDNCSNFKIYKTKILYSGEEKVIDFLNFLIQIVNRDYENLLVHIVKLKTKDVLNLSVKRLSL